MSEMCSVLGLLEVELRIIGACRGEGRYRKQLATDLVMLVFRTLLSLHKQARNCG